MLSSDERAELDALLDAAWTGTNRAGIAAGQAKSMLNDAVQAHREWASVVLDEALYEGLVALVKRHQKKTVVTRRGPVSVVVGALAPSDDRAATNVQLRLDLLTLDQVRHAIDVRGAQVQAATRSIWALRKLEALLLKHPSAAIVADALAAEGVTLEQFLELAA
jgi:hypothetical protein